MLIRCDKCTTVYELDEALLPAQGAPVQCSKCQYVFTAYPPPPAPGPSVRDAPAHARGEAPAVEEPPEDEPVPADLMSGGGAPAEVPPEPERATPDELTASPDAPTTAREDARAQDEGAAARGAADAAPEVAPPAEPAAAEPEGAVPPTAPDAEESVVSPPRATSRTGAAPRARPARPSSGGSGADARVSGPQFTADGRPIRKVPFPTEDPQPPRELPGLKPPKGGVRIDAGRRRTGWVVVAAVLLVLALVFAGWRLLGRRSDGAAASRPVGSAEPAAAGGTERQAAAEPSVATPPAAASPDRAAEPERRARGKVLPTAAPAHPGRNAPKT